MKKILMVFAVLLLISGCIDVRESKPVKTPEYFLDVDFLKKNDDGTVIFLIKLRLTPKSTIYVERLARLKNHDGNFKPNTRIDLINCEPEINGVVECDVLQF